MEHLTTGFDVGGRFVPAVIDVSFHVSAGETLCLVGESGSGKSVTALSILRLVQPPGRIAGGRLMFNGRDLRALPERAMQQVRGAEIALIFQEPMTALNPVFTIGYQIEETLRVHGRATRRTARLRAIELLDVVRIPEPQTRVRDYPHQLSGGLRQRALIAMSLACEPALVIADEPTTALDVTIQAQILDLLRDLQRSMGLALLLITHDLGVVAEMAGRVAVMYAGRIVEEAPVTALFAHPKHPYTIGLLASIPGGAPGTRLRAIQGTVPPLGELPAGCAFAPRCPDRFDPCSNAPPGTTVFTVLPPEGGSHGGAKNEGGSHGGAKNDTPATKNDSRATKNDTRATKNDIRGTQTDTRAPKNDPRGFRLKAEDPSEERHSAKCYLYSDAVEPDVREREGG